MGIHHHHVLCCGVCSPVSVCCVCITSVCACVVCVCVCCVVCLFIFVCVSVCYHFVLSFVPMVTCTFSRWADSNSVQWSPLLVLSLYMYTVCVHLCVMK